MMRPSNQTILRTVLLALALVNQILTICGKSPLPFSDEQLSEACAMLFTFITAIVAWWKNNSFTQDALHADEYLKKLRSVEDEDN